MQSIPIEVIRHRAASRNWASRSLAERQARLVERAATQRLELTELHAKLAEPLAWLQRGLAVVGSIRTHPRITLLSVLAASLTFGQQASRVRKWMIRGLAIHQLYKTVGAYLRQR